MFRILFILFVSAGHDIETDPRKIKYQEFDTRKAKIQESDYEMRDWHHIIPLFDKLDPERMSNLMNWLGVSYAEMDEIMDLAGMRVVVHYPEEDRVYYTICAVFERGSFRPCSVINFRDPAEIEPKTVFCNGEIFTVQHNYFEINNDRESFALVPDNKNIVYAQVYYGFYNHLVPLTNYLSMPKHYSADIYDDKTSSILCLEWLSDIEAQKVFAVFLHLGLPFCRAKDLIYFGPQFRLILIARFIAWAKFLFPGIDGNNISDLFRNSPLKADRSGIKELENYYGVPILKPDENLGLIISYSRLKAFQLIETLIAQGSSERSTTHLHSLI